jgi:hypothetical protein
MARAPRLTWGLMFFLVERQGMALVTNVGPANAVLRLNFRGRLEASPF